MKLTLNKTVRHLSPAYSSDFDPVRFEQVQNDSKMWDS